MHPVSQQEEVAWLFPPSPPALITGKKRIYKTLETAGEGTYSTVYRITDGHNQFVAKVGRVGNEFFKALQREEQILCHMQKQSLTQPIIKLLDSSENCLIFESFEIDLEHLVWNRYPKGLPLNKIEAIARQLFEGLDFLLNPRVGVIHADLKPANILLKDEVTMRIAIADFGIACMAGERIPNYLQSRYYRSPEMILNDRATSAIDMWSAGCVLAMLYLGKPLFTGQSSASQLLSIVRSLGPIPETMGKNSGILKNKAFQDALELSLIAPMGVLNTILRKARGWRIVTPTDIPLIDLVEKILRYDSSRLTPKEALNHPFLQNMPSSRMQDSDGQ